MDQKMLREINNDDLTPKKHDFFHQNEIHERIRNDEAVIVTGNMVLNLFMSSKNPNK